MMLPEENLRSYTLACLRNGWPLAKLQLESPFVVALHKQQVIRPCTFQTMLEGIEYSTLVQFVFETVHNSTLEVISRLARLIARLFQKVFDSYPSCKGITQNGRSPCYRVEEGFSTLTY